VFFKASFFVFENAVIINDPENSAIILKFSIKAELVRPITDPGIL